MPQAHVPEAGPHAHASRSGQRPPAARPESATPAALPRSGGQPPAEPASQAGSLAATAHAGSPHGQAGPQATPPQATPPQAGSPHGQAGPQATPPQAGSPHGQATPQAAPPPAGAKHSQAAPPPAGAKDGPVSARPGQQPPAPRPEPAAPAAPREAAVPAARGGVPGPGVVERVAQAVARGIEGRDRGRGDDGPRGPVRGAAVTEVPVHLPFRPSPAAPAAPTPARRPAEPAAAPARRVPRGDERLREHRGPVLPGWIAVAVGGLALTGCAAVLWRAGVVPAVLVAAFGVRPRPYHGLSVTHWPPLAFLGVVTLLALGGLGRAKAGHAWVLTLFGRYRGTVRRTGLTWVSPLLLRRRVDVRLRHWRSEPMPAVDSGGLALQVVVQVVWQVRDTARATLAVEDHIEYLAQQVESATARVLSRLPADAFHDDAPTLRDAEAVGEALTRTLAAETEAVGIEVFSAQPTRIEYAPEVAEAMRRRRIAAIDAKHRDSVLTAVVDAVDDTVHRLTSRGIVELDDYERKALVKDLTVAFYTGRSDQ
ncbi:SPFH domain-containing protein [Streptomyces sp. NPDC001546]|uniref:SPFH domain-containing protein n=1 Tax=Streptomyces sp. NPDC001546 TaxID=3364585 RepID=UPI0036CD7006